MPRSSTGTIRSRPTSVLRCACECVERRLLLTAGMTFINGPTYTDPTEEYHYSPSVGRFNNDSFPDLIVGIHYVGHPFPNGSYDVWHGVGNGAFTFVQTLDVPFQTEGQTAV